MLSLCQTGMGNTGWQNVRKDHRCCIKYKNCKYPSTSQIYTAADSADSRLLPTLGSWLQSTLLSQFHLLAPASLSCVLNNCCTCFIFLQDCQDLLHLQSYWTVEVPWRGNTRHSSRQAKAQGSQPELHGFCPCPAIADPITGVSKCFKPVNRPTPLCKYQSISEIFLFAEVASDVEILKAVAATLATPGPEVPVWANELCNVWCRGASNMMERGFLKNTSTSI